MINREYQAATVIGNLGFVLMDDGSIRMTLIEGVCADTNEHRANKKRRRMADKLTRHK